MQNKLLARQIKKYLANRNWQEDQDLKNLFAAIGQSYREYEQNQKLSEHAFNLVDQEYSSLTEQLIKSKELAETANAAKSEFLANVSHELRTPLNGVLGFSDLLIKTPLNEAQKKYIDIVYHSAGTLLDLIDNILDFSKLDATKLQLKESMVDVKAITHQVAEMLLPQAESKGLYIEVTWDERIPCLIVADEIRLRQVLTNLASNAVKFTDSGKVMVDVLLKEKPCDTEVKLQFRVSDTGKGIKSENQKKIFDAFFQEDISTTKKFGGTGLGLTISNRLLNLMDSELKLNSEPGKGSTFYFDLNTRLHLLAS